MSKRKRQQPAAPPAVDEPIRVLESVVGSVNDQPFLFGAATWAQLWAASQVAQLGGILGIPPGKVLRVEAWIVDASTEAERVAIARQGPRTGPDFDVLHADAELPPKEVGRA
jgi:hypothetical protein